MVKSVLHSWSQIKWAGWVFGSASQFVEWIITISILYIISQVYVGYTIHPRYIYIYIYGGCSKFWFRGWRIGTSCARPCALLRGLGFRAHVFIGLYCQYVAYIFFWWQISPQYNEQSKWYMALRDQETPCIHDRRTRWVDWMDGWMMDGWNGMVQTCFKPVSDLFRTQFKLAGFWGPLCTECKIVNMCRRMVTRPLKSFFPICIQWGLPASTNIFSSLFFPICMQGCVLSVV